MDFSIIIVNYNSGSYLDSCIKSIMDDVRNSNYKIVIIDNASTDSSVNLIRNKYPKVTIIENAKNVGFSVANNQGLTNSSGKYILFLNHDTYVKPGAINTLMHFMEENPKAGACGAKLLNADGTIQHQCKRGFPTPLSILFYILGLNKLFPNSSLFGHYLMTYIDPEKTTEIDALSGACMLVRKSILDKVGGLDINFFLYGEDIDLCYRIKELGWKIFYVPQAEIIHYGGVGSRTMSYKATIEFHRSMFLFYKKHYKNKYPFFVGWIVYTGITVKLFISLLMNFIKKEKVVGTKKPSS